MSYYLLPLHFDTPVHFGAAENGGKLEQNSLEYHSDTLISAIFTEMALQGAKESLEKMKQDLETGRVLFSDLLPYRITNKGDYYFYLPKPLLNVSRERQDETVSLEVVRKQATERKKQKQMTYIRASRIKTYLDSLYHGKFFSENANFGSMSLRQQVNCRKEEPLPYYVGQFTFAEDNGLYVIIYCDSEEVFTEIKYIFQSLGYSGIGGKRSSGYGKFHIEQDDFIKLDEQKEYVGFTEDDKALYEMLINKHAGIQMNLSLVLPIKETLTTLKKSAYQLCKRSGFVTQINGGADQKKNSVYMIKAGSCFESRIQGSMVSLGQNSGHEIWRCGMGLYAGIDI